MMPYHGYQLFELERPKSSAEQRAADNRRGELAATMARPIARTAAQMRAMMAGRPAARSSARPAGDSPQRTCGREVVTR
jgi:hypothetical protein